MSQEPLQVSTPDHHARTPASAISPFSPATPNRTSSERPRVTFDRHRSNSSQNILSPGGSRMVRRRSSIAPQDRPEEPVYHDSRAATKAEFRRRASTLQDYYKANPHLLPQLPFTFRHGFKRWKLGGLIALMVIDACAIPLVLYYAMTFSGHVAGWITFAVITTIWGGPTYFEFAIRSWRLIQKERFFRPLGASGRWNFDITHWIFVVTLVTTTTLLIVGAAPHEVWLRVLSMPGPGLLYGIGGCLLIVDIYHLAKWKAPFRLSSTPKGGVVNPGVYYIVEDIVAVNAGGGLPFREGWAARYEASPVFRKMIRDQSLFWSFPSVIIAIACTIVVCDQNVPKPIAYAIGWGIPFIWALIWAGISVIWVRKAMHRETVTWEENQKLEMSNNGSNANVEKDSPA